MLLRVKTVEKDGYDAIQLGFEDKKDKQHEWRKGSFQKAGVTPKRTLAEFKGFGKRLQVGLIHCLIF